MKSCPFCGSIPKIKVLPLWHGDHGYLGSYEVYLTCEYYGCEMTVETKHYNTLDGTSIDDCFRSAEKDWNRRCDNDN